MSLHFIAPPNGPIKPSDERFYDLSLRTLMVIVVTALVVCIGYLTWRMMRSAPNPSPVVPVTAVPRNDATALNDISAQTTAQAEVLLKPGQMYRCARNGVVAFSDHPCEGGTERVMRLPEVQ